jgi:hypothetical protein
MAVTTTMSEWLNWLETTDHEDPIGISSEGTSSVASGTPKQDGHKVSIEDSPPSATEVIIVAYQQLSVDYDLPDGTYTPDELRRSKLLMKPGMVMRYRLQWPNSIPQPPHQDSALRAKTEKNGDKSHQSDRQRGRSRAKTDL